MKKQTTILLICTNLALASCSDETTGDSGSDTASADVSGDTMNADAGLDTGGGEDVAIDTGTDDTGPDMTGDTTVDVPDVDAGEQDDASSDAADVSHDEGHPDLSDADHSDTLHDLPDGDHGDTSTDVSDTATDSPLDTESDTDMATTDTGDPCSASPCQNGGICSAADAGYVCDCGDTSGWTGDTCGDPVAVQGEVGFALAETDVDESSAGTVTIVVVLTTSLDALTAPIEVTVVADDDGTAAVDDDYATFDGTLTFAVGAVTGAQGLVQIDVNDERLWEDDETLVLDLTAGSSGTLGTATHTLTIVDDDLISGFGDLGLVVAFDAVGSTPQLQNVERGLAGPGDVEALAYNGSADIHYAIDYGKLFEIDPSGHATVIGYTGYDEPVLGLAWSGVDDVLYMVREGSQNLFRIDPATGATNSVGNTRSTRITGLAYNNDGGTLYGIRADGSLLTIDTETGETAVVGATGYSDMSSLAWHGTLFAVSATTGQLVEIDPDTGEGTLVGSVRSDLWGLAPSAEPDRLAAITAYFANNTRSILYSIQYTTADAEVINSFGGPSKGMAFDPETGTAYVLSAANLFGRELMAFDVDTGAVTYLHTLDEGNMISLAWDPSDDTLLSAQLSNPDRLYRTDVTTGDQTFICEISGSINSADGIALDPTSNTLYTTDRRRNLLLSVDMDTFATADIGALGGDDLDIQGLTWNSNDNKLYGVSDETGEMGTIDIATGAFEGLGIFLEVEGGGIVEALAYDAKRERYFGITQYATVFEVDLSQGEVTLPFGWTVDFSAATYHDGELFVGEEYRVVAYDPGTQLFRVAAAPDCREFLSLTSLPLDNSLFGFDYCDDEWARVDLELGEDHSVASADDSMEGLAYDPDSGTYWAAYSELYTVNPATGELTMVADEFPDRQTMSALTWDTDDGVLYGIANDHDLVEINTETAETTFITSLPWPILGLAAE